MPSDFSIGNLFQVNGLVAVVTGAGSGIGSMIARALAANGASAVYILDINEDSIKEIAQRAVTLLAFCKTSHSLMNNSRNMVIFITSCAT